MHKEVGSVSSENIRIVLLQIYLTSWFESYSYYGSWDYSGQVQ